MSGGAHPPAALVLAAGLVGDRVDAASPPADVAAALTDALDGQALWDPHQDQPGVREQALAEDRLQLPVWRPPEPAVLETHAGVLAETWQAAMERYSPSMVRVRTTNLADLAAVRALGPLGDTWVVASLPARGGRFTWQVPPRIWVVGARATAWREVVEETGWYQLDEAAPDLLVVDGDTVDLDPGPLPRCGAVIAAGSRDPADLLQTAAELAPRASVLAGVPQPFDQWWAAVLQEGLHHNLPLDCALAWRVPDAMVAGVGLALTLTATPSESHAQPVDLDLGPREAQAEPPGAGEDRRRLIVALRDSDKELRRLLPPGRELTLAVQIAIPKRGQIAASAALERPDTDEAVAVLEVEARSDVWAEPRRGRLALRLDDLEEPSDATGWTLTTPAAGSNLLVVIDVSHRGRLLQRATLTAPVREFPLPGDRVRLSVQETSAGASPAREAMAAADVLLDATATELRRWQADGARVPLTNLRTLVDGIEQAASRVLGRDEPPGRLDDPEALALLIDLARKGADLRALIDPLGIGPAPVVTLIVDEESRILPLELVYDAPAPRRNARLCEHAATPPDRGERCDRAGPAIVCPYGFWGLTRTVIRDVLLGPGTRRTPPPRLSLAPVMYAATARADHGADPAARPSTVVEQAATGLFGPLQRATSWSDWRQRVGRARPELLLLLAHTEIARGEAVIEISRSWQGWASVIARPDITPDLLRRGDGPPPLVLLVACASAVLADTSGTLAGTLTSRGAAAVVGVLAQLAGGQAGRVTVALLEELHRGNGTDLATALTSARRRLLADGLLVGLLVVAHGQVDVGLG